MVVVTVQVGRRGTITLPRELRRRYGLDAGDRLTVTECDDGTIELAPEVPANVRRVDRVSQLARQVAQHVAASGATVEDLMRVLDEEREAYYRENYASA
jgi:AbrB family looped-hinge helix DNA binding protein